MNKPHTKARRQVQPTASQFHAKTPHTDSSRISRRALRQQVKQFIIDHRAASLATTDSNGKPHVAIVYCVMGNDFTIYFSTRVEGRKFQNILQQPVVAMAFSHEHAVQMIQLCGVAQRVDDLQHEQSVLHDLMKLRYDDPNWPPPPLQLFERGATNEIAVIQVVPTELTFADFQPSDTGRYKPFFYKII